MRLITALGVLFVLTGFSNSDIPDNFGVSCYENDEKNITFFEFDFDKNVVIMKELFDKDRATYEFAITDIFSSNIVFSMNFGASVVSMFTFDRANLLIRNDFIVADEIRGTFNYKCTLPQV
jgi:hypothetical protein